MAPSRKQNKLEKINGRISIEGICENVEPLDLTKTNQDIEFIERIINNHYLLYKLGKQERRYLAGAMESYHIEKPNYVFMQGTPASMFFIISKGAVQIEINGTKIKEMEKGECFGELALIYAASRSASVKALEYCRFWCLSNRIFQTVLSDMVRNNYALAKPLVNQLALFSFLSQKQRESIAYNMHTLRYQKDDTIFKFGEDANSFYIIV